MHSKEAIDKTFCEPGIKYELTEFESLGKLAHEILDIFSKTATTGRNAGKTIYFVKSRVADSIARRLEFEKLIDQAKQKVEDLIEKAVAA